MTDALASRPTPDRALVEIAAYAADFVPVNAAAFDAARTCLLDALAGGFVALKDPACARLLGPVVRGATMNGGARVPGTSYELDPVTAAYDLGLLLRARDAEGPHPTDTLGGLLAVADWHSRRLRTAGAEPPPMHALLAASIKAYELHCALATANGLSSAGLDDAVYVRVATAAVAAALLGGTQAQALHAASLAFADGAGLHRAAALDSTDRRARLAAADATSRGVRLALLAIAGEMGAADVLTSRATGFEAALLRRPLTFAQSLASSAIESLPFGLRAELEPSIVARFPARQAQAIVALFLDPARIDAMPVHEFVSALVKSGA